LFIHDEGILSSRSLSPIRASSGSRKLPRDAKWNPAFESAPKTKKFLDGESQYLLEIGLRKEKIGLENHFLGLNYLPGGLNYLSGDLSFLSRGLNFPSGGLKNHFLVLNFPSHGSFSKTQSEKVAA